MLHRIYEFPILLNDCGKNDVWNVNNCKHFYLPTGKISYGLTYGVYIKSFCWNQNNWQEISAIFSNLRFIKFSFKFV